MTKRRARTKLDPLLSVDERIVVAFRKATIPVLMCGGEPYIPVAMICTDLGETTTTQLRTLNRRPPFARALRYANVMYPDGQRRKAACLPLGLFAEWLKMISTSERPVERQRQIRAYQRDAARTVYAALTDRARAD